MPARRSAKWPGAGDRGKLRVRDEQAFNGQSDVRRHNGLRDGPT
jgi:hypothetical protein